jgi:pyruvate ferredoxin oxidoreductase gamma subunit
LQFFPSYGITAIPCIFFHKSAILKGKKEVFPLEIQLPVTNAHGYFELRLESIGGLGANLCGKMLGELGALFLGLNASSFSSYGSEKRGSPVKSYVRWCQSQKPVRLNSPVTAPHILAIFHEGLIGIHPVLDGVSDNTRILLATPLSEEDAAARYGISLGKLCCVDALKISMETKSRVNMVMFGAIAGACGFIPLKIAEDLCRKTIGKKYPSLLAANLTAVQRGYAVGCSCASGDGVSANSGVESKSPAQASGSVSRPATEQYLWGYDNAPIGGINPRIGSTVSNDLSPSRQGCLPLFVPGRCIHCGLCDSTCPDQVFQFTPGVYEGKKTMVNSGLDYYHCKGCLRCVEICPVNALVRAEEKDFSREPHFMPCKDLLPDAIKYQKTGANSWITSDSFFIGKN